MNNTTINDRSILKSIKEEEDNTENKESKFSILRLKSLKFKF